MKSNECPIGTRVGMSEYGSMYKGVTITPVTQRPDGVDMVVVEWDGRGMMVQKVEVRKLLPESEIEQELVRVEAERRRLEEEFAAVAAQVKIKADAAAVLINEAQKLADSIKKEARYMGNACDELQEALDNSGWYQSSVSC